MLRAVEWIQERQEAAQNILKVLILTDSESLVNDIKNNTWKTKDE